MTTAAQRIWEAIYAAEFVRRVGHTLALLGEVSDATIGAAIDEAGHLADNHGRRVYALQQRPASRFRRRSR